MSIDSERNDASPLGEAQGLGARSHRPEAISLGRYVLLDRIGAGAMGSVHIAWDRELERRVALKLLHPGLEPERFQREAQALAKLKHPNVVTVYDVGRAQGDVFIAMELVEGLSLRRWLGEGPRPRSEVLRVLEAAGRGLAAAHAAGLVHRDFKPDNVLVGADGSVRVVDFGLARLLDDQAPARPVEIEPLDSSELMTRTGVVMGTPRYMAPEQRAGRSAAPPADQYSFCVAAWEALCGEHPVVHDRPFPPPRGKVPARIRAALERGMARAADQRWPSMDALLAEMVRDRPARGLATVAAGVALVAVAAVGWRQSDAPARACAAEVARLPLAWNDGQRAALRQAFVASGATGALAAADSAALALDRYQDGLRAMAGDACRAARVRGIESEAVHGLRAACVARHGLALRVLVDELVHADAALVGGAGQAARALPPLAECGEVEALAAPTRVPADRSLRAPVAALQNELSALGALELAGRYRQVLVRAAAAVPLARIIGFRPLVARALLQLASVQVRLGDRAAAATRVEDALYLAEEAGDDGLVAEAATELVYHGYSGGKLADAHRWTRLAEAGLTRIGASPSAERLRAGLELRLAGLALVEKNAAAAEEHARRALGLLTRFEPESRRVYRALWTIATAQKDLGRPAEAEVALFRAFDLARRLALPPDDVARLHQQLGGVAGRLRRFAEAREQYRLGLALAEQGGAPDGILVSSLINNLAIADARLERWDDAIAGYRRAAAVSEAHDDRRGVVDALINEAALHERRFEWAQARPLLERALAVDRDGEETGADRLGVLISLIRVAAEDGRLADARRYAAIALPLAEKLDPASPDAAHVLAVTGAAYRDDPGRSVPFYQRARPGFERMYGARSPEVAEILGQLGAEQLRGGDAASARLSLEDAFAMAPRALLPDARLALARVRGDARLAEEARAGYQERHDAAGADEARRWVSRLADRH